MNVHVCAHGGTHEDSTYVLHAEAIPCEAEGPGPDLQTQWGKEARDDLRLHRRGRKVKRDTCQIEGCKIYKQSKA